MLEAFLPCFNAHFGVPAAQPGSAYRSLPPGLEMEGVLCFKYVRTVAKDNTVRFGGHTLQLLPGLDRPSYARARVEVQERLDGSLVVAYQGRVLATTEAPPHPAVGGRGRGLGASLLPIQASWWGRAHTMRRPADRRATKATATSPA